MDLGQKKPLKEMQQTLRGKADSWENWLVICRPTGGLLSIAWCRGLEAMVDIVCVGGWVFTGGGK